MDEKVNEIIGAYFDMDVPIVGNVIWWAVIAFLFGIVLVLILGRKKVFKRRFKLWNALTGLYYIYIPILFAVFGGLFGGLIGANKMIKQNIEAQSETIVESILSDIEEFKEYSNIENLKLGDYSTKELKDMYFSDILDQGKDFIDNVAEQAGEKVFESFNSGIVDFKIKGLDLDKTAENVVESLRNVDVANLDKSFSKEISKNISTEVDSTFKRLYLVQILNLLLLLAIPIIETIVYFSFFRKRKSDKVSISKF